MATKPAATFTFATDALFTSGPANGLAVKVTPTGAAQGYVPGDGIESETVNYLFNICGQWVTDWLIAGSSAAGEDAHLVETDANGQINIARANFAGHTVAGPTVTIAASTSGAALVVTGAANFGATFSASGSLAAVRGTNTGTGAGLEGLALGTDNDGVSGTGTGAGSGVSGTGGATGDGISGTSGATSGAGVRGTAGAAASTGVIGVGFAAAASYAVDGQAGHADATAIRGLTDASATASAVGVLGFGQASGVGVKAQAADGYALLVVGDLTAPVSASVRIAPQDTEPSGADAEGDLYTNGTNNLIWYRDNGGFKAVHHSSFGYAEGFDSAAGNSLSANTEQGNTSEAVCAVNGRVTHDIFVSGNVTLGGTAGDRVIVRLRQGNNQAGTIVATKTVTIPTTVAAAESIDVYLEGVLASQASGSTNYQITVQKVAGGNTYYWGLNTVRARTIGG